MSIFGILWVFLCGMLVGLLLGGPFAHPDCPKCWRIWKASKSPHREMP